MLQFIYGDDEYLINKTIKDLTGRFVEAEKSDFNLHFFDGESISFAKISDAILTAPLFGDKKFVVIKNIFSQITDKDLEKKILKILPQVPESSKVVFTESGKIDARNALYKFLLANAKIHHFAAPSRISLQNSVKKKFLEENLTIELAALDKLLFASEGDLWRLDNEINKLIDFAKSHQKSTLNLPDVDLMVEADLKLKIFDLTDALAQRNLKKVLQLLTDFLSAGEEPAMILNMAAYQIANMLIVSDLLQNHTDKANAKTAGLHPFVWQKTVAAVRNIEFAKIADFYQRLAEIDWQIKTGQKEVVANLTLLFVNFCKDDKIKKIA